MRKELAITGLCFIRNCAGSFVRENRPDFYLYNKIKIFVKIIRRNFNG